VRCGLCLWGCRHGSIYNSGFDVAGLRRRPNFAFEAGALVRRIEPSADGHVLRVESRGGVRVVRAARVVLAAGALATTALVFDRLGQLDRPAPLLDNPVAAVAFAVPGMVGRDLPEECFSLAQIFFQVPIGDGDAAGALYSADGLPLDVFARRMPFTRPAALRLARLLAPALVLGTCYLPSHYSRNTIAVGWTGDRHRLTITGEVTAAARTALNDVRRRLGAGLRRLGALPLPGGFAVARPGSDAHYAGTVPMRREGDAFGAPGCGPDGQVRGAAGLFVADGAALPALPARHCTLTIMANADRIGRALVARGRAT
jgi:choline dehydrogenase-like flavoprotein